LYGRFSHPRERIGETALNIPARQRLLRAVLLLLGVLLLTAAGLKLYGLNVSPVAQYGSFSTPWLQMAAVEWEIVLGLWLLSGAYRTLAWAAAFSTFLTFAAVSGYLGWIGQATCGCFGVIKASPWAAFVTDATALTLLAIGHPGSLFRQQTAIGAEVRSRSGFASILVGAILLVAGVAATASAWYGSPTAALARLRGEPLTLQAGYLELGEGEPGEVLQAQVAVRNWTDQPVHVVGGTSDCSCVTTDDLPVVIPAGGSAELTVRLKIPQATTGKLTRKTVLWTDCAGARTVRLQLGCRVR
jgi:hypothetical protein